jgi:hypothetical protein
MKVLRDGDVIYLSTHCRVEDAEALAALLQPLEGVTVDVSGCDSLHAAIVQVLLVFGASVRGAPVDPFLRDRLVPALVRTETVN